MEGFLFSFIMIIVFCLYALPGIVAINRKHNNANSITILNIFLGWTFLCWVICLAWAFSDNTKKPNSSPPSLEGL